jgi:hypothetical protein
MSSVKRINLNWNNYFLLLQSIIGTQMSEERDKNFSVLSRQKAKEEKRAAALRSNLKRRKVQNRNRAEKKEK